jgi:hypothetical protein
MQRLSKGARSLLLPAIPARVILRRLASRSKRASRSANEERGSSAKEALQGAGGTLIEHHDALQQRLPCSKAKPTKVSARPHAKVVKGGQQPFLPANPARVILRRARIRSQRPLRRANEERGSSAKEALRRRLSRASSSPRWRDEQGSSRHRQTPTP